MAKLAGEESTSVDPAVSEWGNPDRGNTIDSAFGGEVTGRTEISKYPEEKKSNEIPLVATSEKGSAQTRTSVLGL